MESISSLVSQYRLLKAQRDIVDGQMQDIKAALEPLIDEHGNWQDAEGYARYTTVKPSVSLDTKAVVNLMHSWLQSADPIMQSCGDMLKGCTGEKSGSTYLSVK